MSSDQHAIGWGPGGWGGYPFALNLDSVQEAQENWELNLILDDGRQATAYTYDSGDGRRRLGKVVLLDASRGLTGTTLYVPRNELELALRFFDENHAPIEELDCILNLAEWRFYELPHGRKRALDIRGGGDHHVGLVETGGARIRYGEKNYEDPLIKAHREADKAGPLSKATGLITQFATLVMRTYLGAFVAYNFLKFKTFKACFIAALVFGVLSGGTLRGMFGLLFGSGCAKVGFVFLPVLAILYLALNPESYYELIDTPGLFFGWANWSWDSEELIHGMLYATAGLAIAWIILHPFFAKGDEEGEPPQA